MSNVITGHQSTQGDNYQLNTTNLFRQAFVTHPEQEIVHRDAAGQWHTTMFIASSRPAGASMKRSIESTAPRTP